MVPAMQCALRGFNWVLFGGGIVRKCLWQLDLSLHGDILGGTCPYLFALYPAIRGDLANSAEMEFWCDPHAAQ